MMPSSLLVAIQTISLNDNLAWNCFLTGSTYNPVPTKNRKGKRARALQKRQQKKQHKHIRRRGWEDCHTIVTEHVLKKMCCSELVLLHIPTSSGYMV